MFFFYYEVWSRNIIHELSDSATDELGNIFDLRKLSKYTSERLKVISVGGGAFLQDDIRQACMENAIVFYLDISWNSWKDRLNMLIDSRPVLQNRSIEEIESLFHERKEIYLEHNSHLVTDKFNQEVVAAYIIDSLKLAWELYD